MTDNINSKNIKALEVQEPENKEEIKKCITFFNESECIANYIIEKIISLIMTQTTKNKVEKLIPDYCFDEIKESLEIVTHLDFLTHDIDDIKTKKKLFYKKMKSAIYQENDISLFEEDNEKNLNNSEIIRNYKLLKNLDIKDINDLSFYLDPFNLTKNEFEEKEKEKVVMGILTRENSKDKLINIQKEEEKKRNRIEKRNHHKNHNFIGYKERINKEIYSSEVEPFQINPKEKIDTIGNVEIHKIELPPSHLINNKKSNNNVPFDSIIDSTNFWSSISEPYSPPIDRDAGTKIKYDRKTFIKMIKSLNKTDKIVEEVNSPNKKEEKSPKKKPTFSVKKKDNNAPIKKKKYVQIEFESYDLEPNKYKSQYDTEEMAELRIKVEKELQEKKIEKEKQAQKEKERLAKEEELAELRKELGKKNVTVDIKGELVFIKPIDLNALSDDFNKGKSKFKIIQTIKTDIEYLDNPKNIVVERNQEVNLGDSKDDKTNKKKSKKKKEILSSVKNNNNNSISSISKKNDKKEVIDKNSMKYAAGSNFGIINPEVGVNIREEKKLKSGGKDFFKKYNRFSFELFQDKLSKTVTSNFFPKISEQLNDNNNNNDANKRRGSLSIKAKIKKDIINQIINTREPNEDNNTLSLKTDNLKRALENLNLITEGEERKLENLKFKKKDIIKEKKNKSKKKKLDYGEMDIFAKTLMESQDWGGKLYGEKKKIYDFKIPAKPEENELLRELPMNILRHMPRKRLPPIANYLKGNSMGQTISGFYTDRKPKKLKIMLGENKKEIKNEKDNSNFKNINI